MFSLFCLDNLFLPLQKPVQEQRDTQEPHLLTKSFVFAVALFPRYLQQALHAVFGRLSYPTVLAQCLLACRACMWVDVLCKQKLNKANFLLNALARLDKFDSIHITGHLAMNQLKFKSNKILTFYMCHSF